MPYAPPEGERWTETLVEAALEAAWGENPRTAAAAVFLSAAMNLLITHREERQALHWRGYSKQTQLRDFVPECLREHGVSRRTYEDRWRRGVAILTRSLNEHWDALQRDKKILDARKRCA